MASFWRQRVSRYAEEGRLLNAPPRNDSTASTRKTTKRIFATAMNELETTPKPKKAAIKAMMKNAIANCNMAKFSLKKCWAQLAKCQEAFVLLDRVHRCDVDGRPEGRGSSFPPRLSTLFS